MDRICQNCDGKIFPSEQESSARYKARKFCSSSCSAKASNSKRAKASICTNCKSNYKRNNAGQKFCSTICSAEYRWTTVTKPRILEGKCSNRKTLRRFLIKRDGDLCSLCGMDSWQDAPIIFEVDHIDGDPSNNLPNNLRLLCPNCHSQTEFFCGRNNGNGRGSRGLPTY